MKFIPFEQPHLLQVVAWFETEDEAIAWGGWQFEWPIKPSLFLERGELPEVNYFVLAEGDEVVGFIEILRVNRYHYRLCRVAVHNQRRGQKLGNLLVSAAINYIETETPAMVVTLAVFQHNVVALNCYLKLGFQVTDQGPKLKTFNGVDWPLYQMERVISR
ncbi:GNAT family N-acetyltransferase [Vibrio sp. SCSIO 43136]|uniref:GNAT family N-acetyltransferase n=1 Tax=Vibrio sp. SCSIO 43136 TaxID=2819101 RepID=UPI002074FEA5|nr:GNAT family N-acetyltransferase [Vibrio sp. SCSIO 43136]USD67670.1 GNAT family N-acetyltransferase [Vibrio sp. SCSIO 43136]